MEDEMKRILIIAVVLLITAIGTLFVSDRIYDTTKPAGMVSSYFRALNNHDYEVVNKIKQEDVSYNGSTDIVMLRLLSMKEDKHYAEGISYIAKNYAVASYEVVFLKISKPGGDVLGTDGINRKWVVLTKETADSPWRLVSVGEG
jgi:hypothetical protein